MKKINFLALFLWLCGTATVFAQKTAQQWADKAALATEKHHKLIYYTKAWYADRTNTKYLFALANTKFNLARYQEAVNDLDSVLVKKPQACDQSSLLELRGRCMLRLGKPDQAVKDWERVIKECPKYANANTLLADFYLEKKDYETCLKYAAEGIRLAPTHDLSFLLKAKAHSAKGQLEDAIAAAAQAIGLNGVYVRQARYARGEAYRRQGKLDLALADLNQLGEADAQFSVGEIHFANGDFLNAIRAYERGRNLRPNFPEAAERKKEAYRKLNAGKEEEAKPSRPVADTGPKGRGCILSKVPPPAERKPFMALRFSGAPLPSSVDLSPDMPEVRDQKYQGSCAAFTLAYLSGFHERKETGKSTVFSPAFLYNQKHIRKGGGMMINEALAFWKESGICAEKDMPYNYRDSLSKPTSAIVRKAKKYRILRFDQMYDLPDVKATLNAQQPVIIGIGVDQTFSQYKSGVWAGPKYPSGGHAMLVVGYDDDKKAVKIINSWGADWGERGYGWISYDYIERMIARGEINFFATKDAQNSSEYDEDDLADPDDKNKPDPGPKPENTFWEDFLEALLEGTGDYLGTQSQISLPYVTHNQSCSFQNGLYVSGSINVPAYAGYNCQVVVFFYNKWTGQPVGSFVPAYTSYTGQAATCTPQVSLPYTGLQGQMWQVCIPYSAFNVGYGRTDLYGVPMLFVDNYGVAQGQPFDFWMTR